MKNQSQSILACLLMVFALTACHETRSPTDPGGVQPGFPGSYALTGNVAAAGADRAPIAGAKIDLQTSARNSGPNSTVTDASGNYRISDLQKGTYTIFASHEGFLEAETVLLFDGAGGELRHDFVLARDSGGPLPVYSLSGMTWVRGEEGTSAYVGAKVEVLDGPQSGLNEESDEMGIYQLRGLVAGTVHVRASQGGRSETKSIDFSGSPKTIFVDFSF